MMSFPDPLMTYQEAARFLNMPVGTLYALVSQKRIPHLRLSQRMVRFQPAELAAWLRKRAVLPGEEEADGNVPPGKP